MASMMQSLNITGSALTAERFRMNIILQNLASTSTTRTASGEPYRRKQVIFEEKGLDFQSALADESYKLKNGGVRVAQVVESDRDFTPVYDPDNPEANEEGYVMYPNVNRTEEQIDLMAATRAYEANLTALSTIKATINKALEMGK